MDTSKPEIFGWFYDHHREILETLMREHGVFRVLEIGSFLGRSTAFFAERADRVVCVDPFVMWPDGRENDDALKAGDDFFDRFTENMKAAGVWHKIFPMRMTSDEFFADHAAECGPYDLIYIDGQHDYASVSRDIKNAVALKPKVICGDDYDRSWPGVMVAVDQAFGGMAMTHGNVWYVVL